PQADMAAVLGAEYDKTTGVTRVPPEKMQQFLIWQSKKAAIDPRYNNGAFALRQYPAEAPLGSGINDKPSDVVPSDMQMAMGGAPIPSNPGPVSSPASSKPKADGPITPTSQAQFDALPSGTKFINPSNGQLMVKK
ncbi:MAG TPA: hypothetical protein VMV33_08985, partial [Rhodocyclaceae bacterium]|nr:hypothetical protein [Rhodocyclaceae bacterium]